MRQRFGGLARRKGFNHGGDFPRCHIGGHADNTAGADGHEWQDQAVVSAENAETRTYRRSNLAYAIASAASLLDAYDVPAILGEEADGFDANLDAAPARDAVKDEGQFRFSRDGAKMLKQPFLGGLVIIGRHLERTVRADLLRLPG